MEGCDADTNACVAGALLGAFLGWKGLPAEWRDNLKEGVWLEWMTEGLCETPGVSEGGFAARYVLILRQMVVGDITLRKSLISAGQSGMKGFASVRSIIRGKKAKVEP
jgi:hypothetical protein